MTIIYERLRIASVAALAAAALAVCGSGFSSGAPRSSPQVDALVRQVIDAYVGKTVLDRIHSLSARGVLQSPLYERPADYSYDLEQNRRLRVEIRSGGSFELRIMNGTKGYYETADSLPAEVSGARLLAMIYQFKELTMPYQLMTSSFTIEDGGMAEVNGAPARLLLLRDSEGPPMKLYIDGKSGRILKDSGVFMMAGGETELSSEFHDFRKVKGRLFPFRIVNYAGGQRIGEIRISEYRVNPRLPDSLFTMDMNAAGSN